MYLTHVLDSIFSGPFNARFCADPRSKTDADNERQRRAGGGIPLGTERHRTKSGHPERKYNEGSRARSPAGSGLSMAANGNPGLSTPSQLRFGSGRRLSGLRYILEPTL
jgi:hypothetical protein